MFCSNLSLQYPGQDSWILWLPSPSGWWGDGDAGWAGAGLCCLLCVEITTYKNKFNSIKTKGPSSDLSVALDVFLSSLKCEMNGTSQGRGVCIV